MGRNTEIYILNKESASANLYQDLKCNTLYGSTFKAYMNERGQDFEKVLAAVGQDIGNISPSYFFEIVSYLEIGLQLGQFSNESLHGELDRDLNRKNERALIGALKKYGISLLCQIQTSLLCYSYMFQFANYTDFFPIKETYDDGYNISSSVFLAFNDYMILIMHEIIKTGLSHGCAIDDFSKNEIDKVMHQYPPNVVMHKCVDKELAWLKSCMTADDEAYMAEKNTVRSAGLLLNQSLEMKRKIDPEANPRIVIVDSI